MGNVISVAKLVLAVAALIVVMTGWLFMAYGIAAGVALVTWWMLDGGVLGAVCGALVFIVCLFVVNLMLCEITE